MDFRDESLWLMQGDCLERMKEIPSGSVDMVLTDLPYGTTACKWDVLIDFTEMWNQIKRVTKPNAAIVMTSSQPFTSLLIASNFKNFKYEWIWEKSRSTGFLQAKFMPMKNHESVLVFSEDESDHCNMPVFVYQGKPTYNPQKTTGHAPTNSAKGYGHSPTFGASKERDYKGGDTTRNPNTVLKFKSERGFHPTQKPVALGEYMINTYTNEGETVFDLTMGSGSFGVSAKNTNRKFIGIEKDFDMFCVAKNRIESHGKL